MEAICHQELDFFTILMTFLIRWVLRLINVTFWYCVMIFVNIWKITLNSVKVVKIKVAQSCPTLCDPMDYTVQGIRQVRILEWVAFPFSRVFPTQGLNPGLLHCRRILYQLSHKGSPRILEWVAYPFSRGSSWPKNLTGVSCIAGEFFINWAIREALISTFQMTNEWCYKTMYESKIHSCTVYNSQDMEAT